MKKGDLSSSGKDATLNDEETKVTPIPSPKERPDLYDYYDCNEAKYPTAQRELITPEHVKVAIAKRKVALSKRHQQVAE
jgi:hypothetical protein